LDWRSAGAVEPGYAYAMALMGYNLMAAGYFPTEWRTNGVGLPATDANNKLR